jgi:hypothetical protein
MLATCGGASSCKQLLTQWVGCHTRACVSSWRTNIAPLLATVRQYAQRANAGHCSEQSCIPSKALLNSNCRLSLLEVHRSGYWQILVILYTGRTMPAGRCHRYVGSTTPLVRGLETYRQPFQELPCLLVQMCATQHMRLFSPQGFTSTIGMMQKSRYFFRAAGGDKPDGFLAGSQADTTRMESVSCFCRWTCLIERSKSQDMIYGVVTLMWLIIQRPSGDHCLTRRKLARHQILNALETTTATRLADRVRTETHADLSVQQHAARHAGLALQLQPRVSSLFVVLVVTGWFTQPSLARLVDSAVFTVVQPGKESMHAERREAALCLKSS